MIKGYRYTNQVYKWLIFFVVAASMVATNAAHGVTGDQNASRNTPNTKSELTYLINDSAGKPYQITQPSQQTSGIITDILTAAFEDTQIQITPLIVPVKRAKRNMYSGQLTHWITYGLRSWENDKEWDQQYLYLSSVDLFPYHYGLSSLQPIRNNCKDAPLPSSLNHINQVAGKNVIVISGFQYGGLKKRLTHLKANIVEAKNHSHAIALLERKRGDFYLGNHYRLNYLYRELGNEQHWIKLEYLLETTPVTLLMDSSIDNDIKTMINRKLAAMKTNGEIENILDRYKYFPPPEQLNTTCHDTKY